MRPGLSVEPRHRWLAFWLNGSGHEVANDRASLKAALASEGVNSRGLRLYLDYGDRLFSPLAPAWIRPNDSPTNCHRALAYLRLLQGCEMDLAPPGQLVRAIADSGLAEFDAPFVSLFRSAWRAMCQAQYAGVPSERWLAEECIPLVSWVMAQDDTSPVGNRLHRMAWPNLRARWDEDRRNRALPRWTDEWKPPWGYLTMAPQLLWVPLTSAAALEDEGEVMKHCVADYTETCRDGRYVVYSLRRIPTRRRVATLGLARVGVRGWAIDQFKGSRNESPDALSQCAADLFLARLRKGLRYPDDMLEDADWRAEAMRPGGAMRMLQPRRRHQWAA